MQTGTVTRMFELRGFGFITPDDSDRDVFLGSEIIESLTINLIEGQRVEFEAVETEPGLIVTSLKAVAGS
ncbi:MAG: cold shock domain-containing protein [Phycisphaerales bacterium]|jgi:CspA family cold shock protein|nr:cold shock domain-containing protein [Phycisphaerales bacterium]